MCHLETIGHDEGVLGVTLLKDGVDVCFLSYTTWPPGSYSSAASTKCQVFSARQFNEIWHIADLIVFTPKCSASNAAHLNTQALCCKAELDRTPSKLL